MKIVQAGELLKLHLLLMIYSVSGILSKMAGKTRFLSLKFCAYYAGVIILLGVYALGWQQIIKKLPLSKAYANKAITIVWGMLWGICFFHENITVGKILGALIVASGVILFAVEQEGEM